LFYLLFENLSIIFIIFSPDYSIQMCRDLFFNKLRNLASEFTVSITNSKTNIISISQEIDYKKEWVLVRFLIILWVLSSSGFIAISIVHFFIIPFISIANNFDRKLIFIIKRISWTGGIFCLIDQINTFFW
jgi:hypothetical protein